MMAARLYNIERWTDEDDRLIRTNVGNRKKPDVDDRSSQARAEDLGLCIAGTDIGKRKRR